MSGGAGLNGHYLCLNSGKEVFVLAYECVCVCVGAFD